MTKKTNKQKKKQQTNKQQKTAAMFYKFQITTIHNVANSDSVLWHINPCGLYNTKSYIYDL